jgi:PAS domain S-box-containing protein
MPEFENSLLALLPGMAYRCLPDEHFTMLAVSDGAFDLLGYHPHELVGPNAVPWRDIIHPDDHQLGRDVIKASLTAGRRFETEFRLRRRDGTQRWAFVRGQGVFDAAGRLQLIEGFIQDITSFRELEAARREALDSLEAFFDAEHIGLTVMRPVDDGTDALFVVSSPAIARYYGLTVGALRGKRLSEVQADRELVRQFMDRVRQMRLGDRRQLWTVSATTTEVRTHFLLSMVMLDRWNGQPGHIALAAVDISRQAEAEEQLRRVQKMEAVGQLAAGMAHDFNNVLTSIAAHADLMAESAQDSRSEHGALAFDEDLRGMRAAIAAGVELTKRLLLVARRGPLRKQQVDVDALLDTVGLLARRLLGNQVEVVERRTRPLPLIEADGSQIEQALLNLIVNARDAMPTGGTLTIAAAVQLLPEHEQRLLVLSVSDTGCGMSEATRARAFEAFFTTKGEGHGSGLGLAMVQDACQCAGGRVEIDTEPGAGTRVSLILPVPADA